MAFQPSDDSYGLDRVLTRISDVLIANSWDVRCIIESTNPGTGWLSMELSQRRVPVEKARLANLVRRQLTNPLLFLRWGLVAVLALPRTVRLARTADIVYVNGFTLPLPALAGRVCRRQVIWHLHEIPPAGRFLGRVVRALSTRQICVSAAVASAFGLLDLATCDIVHNAVDVPELAASQPEADGARPMEIGIVARINRGKGHLVLAAAFKELLHREMPVRLHVVGAPHASDPEIAAALKDELRDVPADRIEWAGEVVSGASYMQKLQVLAAPSVRPDPFPLSVLEGMAAGLVVVASDGGGHREAIQDGATGFLCRPGDPQHLAEILAALVTDTASRRHVGTAAREDVIRRFSPDVFAANLLQVVNEVAQIHA